MLLALGPLGDAIETFIRREDAERFIEEVRSDDPELPSYQQSGARARVGRRGLHPLRSGNRTPSYRGRSLVQRIERRPRGLPLRKGGRVGNGVHWSHDGSVRCRHTV
jgi:hypothetical protein